MTTRPPAVLDTLWETIPTGQAPMKHLVARGRVVRRRRRVLRLGAVAAVVAAVAVAGVALRPSDDRATVATPPPGTRYVGIGQVAVAVPVGWDDGAATCNVAYRDTVFFPWPQDCIGGGRSVSSVAISAQRPRSGLTRMPDAIGRVDGHDVVGSPAVCLPGTGPESCQQWFGIPDLHVYFDVRIPRSVRDALDRVHAIRDSLTVLPPGQTAVPFVSPWLSLGAWRSALENAGFAVRVEHLTDPDPPFSCPPAASCTSGIETRPAAGRVERSGSTVTLEVKD